MVGANFEARPNVALDVAGQLLKSLNAAVLRTGAAALRTVTVLVDDVLRPALERSGPAARGGRPRAHADREGARVLVSMPSLVPLVILRGSGPSTAELARLAAQNDVRTLAHAEGGGVLYVHAAADRGKALALAEASLDRLGVCNRLNLALVDRGARGAPRGAPRPVRRARAWMSEATFPAREPLDRPIGYEWAGDPERVATVTVALVDGIDEALRIANAETSGLAAGIVTEDAAAADRFLDGYRGTAAFWHAPTRFTDGFELTGSPETGINVDRVPGPRGPVTYRDLWLRQYRVDRRRETDPVTVVVKLGSSLVVGRGGHVRRGVLRARGREIRRDRAARPAGLRRLVGRDRPRPAPPGSRPPAAEHQPSPGRLRARPGPAPGGLGPGARSSARRAGPAHRRRHRRPHDLRQRPGSARTRCSGSAPCRS